MNDPSVAVDNATYRKKLEAAETELLDLAGALDDPVAPELFKLAVLALAHRARTHFRAFLVLCASDVPPAARAVFLRPAVEINTLIRFLAKNPELHIELCEAEGDRNVVSIVEEHRLRHSEYWPPPPLSEEHLEASRRRVAEARARARAAGIAGVGPKGPVLPSIEKQLAVINEPAASEAYTFAYRPMTWEVHTNPRTFLRGHFEERNDGSVSYRDQDDRVGALGARSLSLTTFASTLELAAIHLGLPIEEDVRRVLQREMADPTRSTER